MSGEHLFCFGLGYSAGFLARSVAAEGWRVSGTSREGMGTGDVEFALHRFSREAPLGDAKSALEGVTHVLISVPPDVRGCPVEDCHGGDLAALPGLRWVGYLSTTNVYGDRGGGWVDEESAIAPSGERGRWRAAAEASWIERRERTGLPLDVFRLAGIYGPGRNALTSLKAGTARRIVKPGQVFSRIHVADLAAVLRAAIARAQPGRIYNVCDDEPAPPQDLITFAAALLGLEPPPLQDFATAALAPMARSFYDDNKRISNRRIKEELGVRLRYPTYREGLAALAAELGISRERP
jgi:nucleoside-diphosphate-sugar epimerase